MESRKRARLECLAGSSSCSIDAGIDADDAHSDDQSPASIFLSADSSSATAGVDAVGMLPSNVFLTICDETSDESQDFLALDAQTLAQHIKQEPQLQAAAPPLQYRIVNQLDNGVGSSSSNNNNGVSQLTPMQLPSACEIYLVKEFVNNGQPTTTTIKIEPDSGVSAAQLVRGNLPCVVTPKPTITVTNATAITATTNTTATAIATAAATVATATTTNTNTEGGNGGGGKRSYILEAYKKRDDKRRATHNEVERRRRDKINNWIFKLKEMLPADTPNASSTISTNQQTAKSELLQRSANGNSNNNNNSTGNSRTPPSDSKSQILIKACEYIQSMQDELKSLRECLTENERLRLSNQRLQNELQKLKCERLSNSRNGNFNITLNSLNSGANSAGSGLFCGSGNVSSSSSQCTSSNAYTKRELIIRDYVD